MGCLVMLMSFGEQNGGSGRGGGEGGEILDRQSE
jgi:hypothetical protein